MYCFTEWSIRTEVTSVVCISSAAVADDACSHTHGLHEKYVAAFLAKYTFDTYVTFIFAVISSSA